MDDAVALFLAEFLTIIPQVLWIEDIRTSSFSSKRWFVRRRSLGGADEKSGSDSNDEDEGHQSPLRFFKGARASATDPSFLRLMYERLYAIAPSYMVNRVKFIATMRECLFEILGTAKDRVHKLAAKQALREARLRPAGSGTGAGIVHRKAVDGKLASLRST